MRYALLILIASLLNLQGLFAQDDVIIDWDYEGTTFGEFVQKTESLHLFRFFYQDGWVKDLKLGNYGDSIPLAGLLDRLFYEKALYFFRDNSGNIVITKNFTVRIPGGQVSDSGSLIPPSVYYETPDKMLFSGNLFREVGNPAEKNRPGTVVVSGYITDKDTKEPVAGATAYVRQLSAGTLSNQYGFYSLTLPRGIHSVRFSFVGMKEIIVDLNLYGEGEMDIEMNSTLIPLKEAVVSADRSVTLRRPEVGMEKMTIATLKLTPANMGEANIVNSFLLMPGVQSVGEGSAGFNVRGGSADQNLILLYDAPLYNSSHFFGFFSAVNSDIIKDATLYKGGIPAKYGGRTSSVLDIGARDGARKAFAGNAGISPVTTHLMLEGPIIKDTLFYILTGRTTYSNWIFKLFDNAFLNKSSASFYDLNGRLTYDIDRNNKIDLSSYFSRDLFRFNSDTTYLYNNNIVAFRWRHFFNSRFFSVLSVNNSRYNYDISSESLVTEAFRLSHTINSTGLKADFNGYKGRHEINFGLDAVIYSVTPGDYMPAGDSSRIAPMTIPKEKALEPSIYIEDNFKLNENLSVNAGLRFSSFFAFGPRTIFLYDPTYSKGMSTIIDTVTYSPGQVIRVMGGPEYRLSFNYRPSGSSSFKLNYNRTRQYLHLLSSTASISPTDIWKLSDYHLKPQVCDQFAAGYYQLMFSGRLETSVEVYYKKIRNAIEFKGGTRIVMEENIEQYLVDARGKAYGAEFMIRKETGRVLWSLGYTFARTFLQTTGAYSDEIINRGEWFPANYDKPHDLSLSFNYLASRRISFSSNFVYSTGRPITFPIASYNLGNLSLIHYSDRNKYRIPDYMRLDLSLRISGNLRSRKIAHPYLTFSVYNLLGRENVYSVYFRHQNNIITGYKLSVFGRAIPSVTFSFDFK